MTENLDTNENVSVPTEIFMRTARTETSTEPEFKFFRTKQKFVNHGEDSSKVDTVAHILKSESFIEIMDYFDSCLK